MIKLPSKGLITLFAGLIMLLPVMVYSQDGTEASGERIDEQTGNEQGTEEETLLINDSEDPGVALSGELSGFTLWDFLRMILVLGAVIALIYGLFLFLKRAGNPKTGGEAFINLLASQPLNGNRSLHLVQVGVELFLIGSADGAVSLVSRIEDKEFIDQITLQQSSEKSGGRSFSGALRALLGETRGDEERSHEENSALFLGKQKERLKNMQRQR
jgi:flagellar protein FliO/FliZ